MCGYDQIFSCAGGVPTIGGSRGEWRGPPTCQAEGKSPNSRIAEYKYLGYVGTSEN